MKEIFKCRRTFLAFYSVTLLAIIAYTKSIDTSMAISGIIIGIAGANAYEKRPNQKHSNSDSSGNY